MKENLDIIVIEPDSLMQSELENRIHSVGIGTCCSAEPHVTVNQLVSMAPDFAVLGPSMDQVTLLKCIQRLKIVDAHIPILIFCGDHYSLEDAVDVAFEGVYPIRLDCSQSRVSKTVEVALKQRADFASGPDFPVLIGQSEEIREIRERIRRIADKDITVLVTGESGTGKELIARSIHCYSKRVKGPLVKINCSALPDDLLESEIFGFQKGAFTGAHKNKPGRFELADGGTLFIDEIGDLSLSLQVKFLQVLEEKVLSRLGGTRDKVVDARVVAATNADLMKKVGEGNFRKDLFYRLNVVAIEALPLRKRPADIPLLTHYFLNKYCYEFKKDILDIPREVADYLMEYQWPGNVRELENVIRRAIVLRDWRFIYEDLKNGDFQEEEEIDLASDSSDAPIAWDDAKIKSVFDGEDFSLKKITKSYVSEAESEAILKALRETQWNRKKAAQLLRVSYKTLLTRIDEFGLKP